MARAYRDTRSNRWGIDYRDPAGIRRRVMVGNKEQAQAALARVQVAMLEGHYGRLAPRRHVTLEDVEALWFRERTDKRSLETTDRHRFERLTRLLGPTMRVRALTRDRVSELRREMEAEGLGPASRNRHVATLRAALTLAVDHDLIPTNPLTRTKMEPEPPPPDRVLAEDEEAALLAVASPRDRLVVIWALETGARRGEIVAAAWPDFDLRAGEWRIPVTKNGDVRNVPLTPRLVTELRRWRALGHYPRVLGAVSASGVSSAFAALCARAGVEGVRLHDLRHTCATRMRRRGVHPVTIAAVLGHKSWQMVQRYQHVTVEDLRTAVASA